MAETLTYDPGADTVTTESTLTPEEQDSLQVGEELSSQQDQLLAGKYENAKELEKAYIELQKKLGSDEEAEVDTKEDEVEDEEWSEGASLIADASNEFYANNGELSEDTMRQFSEMSSQDLVEAFMEIQRNNPDVGNAPSPDLTDAEINTVYNSVGGEKAYQNILNWATDNVDETKLDAFNSIVNNGDATAIQIAVAGLKAEYDTAEGYEGRMLTGKAAKTSGDVYRSQAEVIQAMNDPRYERDPAYRQDVYDKLERSNVDF